jgi:NTE family protein
LRKGRPLLFINASDIYNRVPFVFSYDTFNALCSSLDSYPIANAVAASSAYPILFTPIVLESFAQNCSYGSPPWMQKAFKDPHSTLNLRAYAQAIQRYRDAGTLRYVRLLDGGITDNYGLHGIIVARATSATPYGPFTAQRAVKIRRLLFLVVDAGRGPKANWATQLNGPDSLEIAEAVTDTAIDSITRNSYDTFRMQLNAWRESLVGWRCSLGSTEVQRLRGSLAGWNCRDVTFEVDRVDFASAGLRLAEQLNEVPTRFNLAAQQVDMVIEGGRNALRNNAAYPKLLAYLEN